MVNKHTKLPIEKQNIERLHAEIEEYGFNIGKRTVDYLGMF